MTSEWTRELYEDELAFATFMIDQLKQMSANMRKEIQDKEYETNPFFRTLRVVRHTPGVGEESYGAFKVDSDGNWSYEPL